MVDVAFKSFSMRRKPASDTFDWCVFVSSPRKIVDTISEVHYTLHPTFKEREIHIRTPENRFSLVSNGWGGFTISIQISFQNAPRVSTTYDLRLEEDSWPRPGPPSFPASSAEGEILATLQNAEKYRWRRTSTLAKRASITDAHARELLLELVSKGICREAPFAALDGEAMWGACSVVGLLPSRAVEYR